MSNGKPTRFGKRKSFFVKSHVPSPTTRLSDEYDTDPGADSASVGAMTASMPCSWQQAKVFFVRYSLRGIRNGARVVVVVGR